MTSKIASHAVGLRDCAAHNLGMARKTKKTGSAKRSATQIKAWRKHRDMSLEKLSERLMVELEYEISPGQLSRIERGEQPYSQDVLEALATVLRCAPADLLMRDPSKAEGIWSIWDTLSQPQQVQVVEIAKTIKRTGTEG